MRARDLNHFIRPNLWIYGIAIFAIGAFASHTWLTEQYAVGILITILLFTSSITANHYYDFHADKKSKQTYRFPVAGGRISRRFAALFSLIVSIFSIILSYPLGSYPLALTLFANFMIYSYSAPPLRIKERSYLETFWNGIGYGTVPFYLALLIAQIPLTASHHLLGLIPFFISASGHILLQVRDIDDDKAGRVKTTSTKLGLMRMKKVSELMVVGAGLIIIYLAATGFLSQLAWISIVAGGYVVYVHKRMGKDVQRSYRSLQLAYILGGVFFIISVI